MHISLDPGSCHVGNKQYARELIELGAEAWHNSGNPDLKMSVKFQLFKRDDKSPNIELNRDLFLELVQYGKQVGIPVTASAFDADALDLLVKVDAPYVKFAYSKQDWKDAIYGCLKRGMKTVVSTDVIRSYEFPESSNLVRLFCEPVYPATCITNFEGMFPAIFDGYSDHHLGLGMTEAAVRAGATWIERHFTLDYDACLSVPDGRFALRPHQVKQLAKEIAAWIPSS